VRPGLPRLALQAARETRDRPLRCRGVTTPSPGLRAAGAGAPGRPAVVLVHGVIVSSRYLVPLAAELGRDRPVLVPDLPGAGLAARPDGPPTMAALADAVVATATAAGHERVALVGNSFGAQVAVEAAARHPDRVERLVLVGPTVDPAARSLARQAVRWARNAPDEHPAFLPVLVRDLADVGLPRAAGLVRLMLEHRIEDRLGAVRAPALVVRGGRDRLVPPPWAQEIARRLPDGRLLTLPGFAHMPHWSGTLALVPHLRAFLG
jgi:2-hydroxy-6-oxonona-2,4-dienedioate hydrolase